MAGRRFDTCFFERYARHTLETFLGSSYSALINEDRPDLQMPDKSLGIEVTRAMEPRKDVAQELLMEMAGVEAPSENTEEMEQIVKSGYGYGLQDGKYIGMLRNDDILEYFLSAKSVDMKTAEKILVGDIVDRSYSRPLYHHSTMEELFELVKEHNAVPVVDDRDCFIGIVLRRDVMNFLLRYYDEEKQI